MDRKLNFSAKVVICLTILTVCFVYPRPFKQADLSHLKPTSLEASEPEYRFVGLWWGCEVEVYDVVAEDVSQLGGLPEGVERLFSPWIASLNGVLSHEAYFWTLDFEECFGALSNRYPRMNLKDQVMGKSTVISLRVGGLAPFSAPLSHADSIIAFLDTGSRKKLMLMKGGD